METALVEADRQMEGSKKCPYCAEEIQRKAIKCRFCGEFLDKSDRPRSKWYFSTSAVVIALLCGGPLALPLVWFNPRYKTITKVVGTCAVVAGTILIIYLTVGMYVRLMGQIEKLGIY